MNREMLSPQNAASGNPPASSAPGDCAERPRFSVGTLIYSKAGLASLLMWLLWGDFCFTMIETVMPSIVPLRLKELESPNWIMGLVLLYRSWQKIGGDKHYVPPNFDNIL